MRTRNQKTRTANSNRQNRRTSSVNSIETGIKIIRYAIRKRVSLTAASNANDRGKNYISDIKARLEENYKSKNITRDTYNTFKSLNRQYEKSVK